MPRRTQTRPTAHEPKPYCAVEGCRLQFHEHPAKAVANLTDVMRLGKCGLEAIFTPGSRWNYGPIYENMDTVVKSLGTAYVSGINYSSQPEDIEARGKPAWFIKCEIVSSPHSVYAPGQHVSLPPGAMVPHNVVLAERRCWAQAAIAASLPATRSKTTIESLERALNDATATINALRGELTEKERELRCERTARDAAERDVRTERELRKCSENEVKRVRGKLNDIRRTLG